VALAALNDASVAYGSAPALGPLSLSVEDGRITALVGPSGCGKSTVLRLLAGLQPPTAGSVDRTVGSGETGMVFQAPTLAPWLSARANVALPLRLAGGPSDEANAAAEAELARVALKPRQLSGGMAMRVALARALVTRPRLLLLDEPFAALDALTRRGLIDDVLSLWSESRPGVLFVTHDVEEAVYLAHRVLVMSGAPGRLAAEVDTPADLPRTPGFRATAAFRDCVEQVMAAIGAEAVA
jgi:NitT/TauT family transport system ATP-binding protein